MAELEEQLEFPKQLLGQFMNDYQHYGKYNLEIQIPHLEKLARFYERRHKLTKHWTDCVKAHTLYNCISARDPQSQVWKHRAFKVQQEYLADNFSISFEQQQTLTSSLKEEIESIRNQSRTDMLAADQLANCFDGAAVTFEQNTDFFAHMSDISMNCSEKMASFAGRIIKECVQLLNPVKPPCDFEAAAIGSIARGEATPYSDLEFFFLVGDKSKESVEYFEKLAVTIYFQIANLEETKLSYMAIKELKGWFDDKAKNGFKIDGLSDQAGNIPTGNGSHNQHNHFIVTPGELAQKYQYILDNPDKEKALRVDLTAMLSYIKPLYSHDANATSLISELRRKTGKLTINKNRQGINLEMLEADVKKFNFRPSGELILNGFAADLKREIYRFPSILLLDINVVTQTSASSSWESLQILKERHEISDHVHFVVALLLASATYMRMSAYLHHDSQDDRMSVCQQTAASVKQQESTEKSSPQSRWFVPSGLFITMCSKMMNLKNHLAKSIDVLSELKRLDLDEDESWSRITSLFYTGRYNEALALLKQAYGENICDDPLSVTSNIQPGQDESEMYLIISETLYWCKEYKASLVIYKHVTDNNIMDMRGRIADCFRGLRDYDKALSILESITDRSADDHHSLGNVYFHMKEYEKAELSYLRALELMYSAIASEQLFDYYGDPIKIEDSTESLNLRSLSEESPEDRLLRIVHSSFGVIICVGSLGQVYRRRQGFTLAKDYFKKVLHLITELFGQGAATTNSALALEDLGNSFRDMGQYSEAEDYYKQALAVYRELSQGADSSDIARTLFNLGYNYQKAGDKSKAVATLREALDMTLQVDPDNPRVKRICQYLVDNCSLFDQVMTDRIPAALPKLAHKLNKKGQKHYHRKEYTQAEECYRQALEVYRALSYNSNIALTLSNLACIYMDMGDRSKADEMFREAIDLYTDIETGDKQISIICHYLTLCTESNTSK